MRSEIEPLLHVSEEEKLWYLGREVVEFKARLIEEGTNGIASDLDETVFNTVFHWVEQMQELFGNPEGKSAAELVAEYGYAQHVPYWKENAEAQAWMEAARHDNELHASLPLISGASDSLGRINKRKPLVAYITARGSDVIEGTQRGIAMAGLPIAPILAKPDYIPVTAATDWKGNVLEYLLPQVEAIIDDHASLKRRLQALQYRGKMLHLGSSDPFEEGSNIIPCIDWQSVEQEV